MGAGELIFAIWVGILGFIAGLVVEAVVDNMELKETKAELAYTRKKMAELRRGLEESHTLEVIEINDPNFKTIKEDDNYFKPF